MPVGGGRRERAISMIKYPHGALGFLYLLVVIDHLNREAISVDRARIASSRG